MAEIFLIFCNQLFESRLAIFLRVHIIIIVNVVLIPGKVLLCLLLFLEIFPDPFAVRVKIINLPAYLARFRTNYFF